LFNVSPIRSNSLFLSSPFIIKVALKREREREKREEREERRGEGRSPSRALVLGIIIIRIICIEENTCAACVRLKIGTKQV
jgi:hypothetical protein